MNTQTTSTQSRAVIGAKIAIPDPTPVGELPVALTSEPLPEKPVGPVAVELTHQPTSIGTVQTPPPEPEVMDHPKEKIIRTHGNVPLREAPVPAYVTFGPPVAVDVTANGIKRELY